MRLSRSICVSFWLVTGSSGATSAFAQVPPTRSAGASDPALPPMPAPSGATGPVPATSTTSVERTPPTPAGMPAPQGSTPNTSYSPVPAAADVQVVSPGDRYGVGLPRRRAWGDGSTLIRRDARVGVYLGPTFKIASINRSPALLIGAEFAVLIGERFAIGAAGSAIVTPLAAQRNDGRTFNLRTQYAGVTLGVALVRVKFFSLAMGALVGGGRVCLNDERLDRCVNRAAMFVAEPELGLSFALTKILRLVLSGGYRFAVAQSWSGPSDRLLSGLSGTLGLRLGRF